MVRGPVPSKPGPVGGPASACSRGLECTICYDSPHKPVVTFCGHLFCWGCLNEWVKIQASKKECPVCKSHLSKVVRILGQDTSAPSSVHISHLDSPVHPSHLEGTLESPHFDVLGQEPSIDGDSNNADVPRSHSTGSVGSAAEIQSEIPRAAGAHPETSSPVSAAPETPIPTERTLQIPTGTQPEIPDLVEGQTGISFPVASRHELAPRRYEVVGQGNALEVQVTPRATESSSQPLAILFADVDPPRPYRTRSHVDAPTGASPVRVSVASAGSSPTRELPQRHRAAMTDGAGLGEGRRRVRLREAIVARERKVLRLVGRWLHECRF